MQRSRLTRIARFTLAAGSSAALLGVAPAASARGIQTGFFNPGASARDELPIDPPVAMNAVEQAGGRIVRIDLYWRVVAPKTSLAPSVADQTDPNFYEWTKGNLEDSVDAALAAGLKVMLTIRSAPDYAQRGGSDARGTHDPDPSMLRRFAKAATAKFDDVRLWGVWNEPNGAYFLTPQYRHGKLVSPAMYRRLLNAAAAAIHDADQKNLVVAGETAPFTHWNPRTGKPTSPGPLLFLRKLLCMSGGSSPKPTCRTNVHADIFSTHPYTSGSPWHHAFNSNDVSFGDLPQWKKLVRAASRAKHITNGRGGHGVSLWITEFSWDSKAPDPKAVPIRLHARWTSEALYRAWQFGVGALVWGQLRDYRIADAPYQSGLYYCDETPSIKDPCSVLVPPSPGTAKISLTAFEFPFVAYARNGRIKAWGRTPDSAAGPVRIERKSSGGWRLLTRASANRQGVFAKSFRSSLTSGYLRATIPSSPEPHSVKFSLTRPKDLFVSPFGCGGKIAC